MKPMGKAKTPKAVLSYDRWIHLSVFFGTACAITFLPIGSGTKLAIALVGFVVPIFLTKSGSSVDSNKTPVPSREIFPDLPTWAVWTLLLLAMGLRFWKLNSLFVWPSSDDSTFGMLVLDQVRHWNGGFFHGFAQHTPIIYWTGALIYQATHSPTLSLWLPSAILSAAAVPLGYLAARKFFPSSFALILALLLSLSYWSILGGRGCLEPPALYLLEIAILYSLGIYLEKGGAGNNGRQAFWIGIVAGAGFLVFPPCWSVVAFGILCVMAATTLFKGKPSHLGWFLAGSLLTSLPFLIAVAREGYGQHLLNVGFWKGALIDQAKVISQYFLVLFGTRGEPAAYTPLWGGFLNPIPASFFFLGVLEMRRGPWKGFVKWGSVLWLLLLAPGFLSWSMDGFRIVQAFPFMMLVVAIGFHAALGSFQPTRALGIAAVVLAASFGTDLYRLVAPYQDIVAHPEKLAAVGKAPDRYRAFRVLEGLRQKAGDGLVFSDFVGEHKEESLAFMTYPFNAAWNPETVGPVRWAGILTSAHYVPFLSKRFPEARWYPLPSGTPEEPSVNILGALPLTPAVAAQVGKWVEAHRFFMDLNTRMIDARNGESQQAILMDLVDSYPRLPEDPFLQSCFLEKLLYNFWTERLYHPEDKTNRYPLYAKTIQSCLKKGYPDAVVREKLVRALVIDGELKEAEVQLRKTLVLDPHNELALQDARLLAAIKKGTVRLGGSGFELNPGGGR